MAATRHRLDGIDKQIGEDLLDLVSIDVCRPQLTWAIDDRQNIAASKVKVYGFFDKLAEIAVFSNWFPAFCKGKELFGKSRSAVE